MPSRQQVRRDLAIISLIVVALAAPRAMAVNNSWASAFSGNWSTPTNWSLGHVPTLTEVATITHTGNYTVTLDVNATVAGLQVGAAPQPGFAQVLAIGGRTLTLAGPGTVTGSGALVLSAGTLNGAGTLTIASGMGWSGGAMSGNGSTTVSGMLIISGTASKTLARPLAISPAGRATWSGGPVAATTTGPITINGSLSVQSNADLVTQTSISGAGTVTFASGRSNISGAYSVATTNVSGGTALFPLAMSTTNLTVSAGTIRLDGSSAVTALTMSGGTLDGNGAVALNGNSTWSGGTLTGLGALTVAATKTLTINGPATKTLRKTLNNAGTISWSDVGSISSGLGTTINNSGTISLLSDAALAFGEGGTAPILNNSGTFTKSGGTGSSTIAATFTNNSNVRAATGTIAFSGGFTQPAGTTTLQNGAISSPAPLAFNGGTLTGTGTIVGNVTNAATVDPNGTITINGNYTQTSAGALKLNLSSLTTFDRLAVSGAAALAGTLTVTWGYVANAGDSFAVITCASRSGTFPNLLVGDKATGIYFFPTYNPQNVTLVASIRYDLNVRKSASPGTVTTGTNVTYTISVTDTQWSDANNVTVTDTLPANMTFVSVTTTKGTCSGTTTITCAIPKLLGSGIVGRAGETATITIVVRANAPGSIANTASATAPGTDFNPGDNTSNAGTTVQGRADLSLQKMDSRAPNQSSVPAGSSFGYALTVQNAGPETATNLVVTDPLPAGTTFVSASGTGWTCTFASGTVTCTMPSLGMLSSTITIQLRAPSAGGNITNTATVTASSIDPLSTNNSASATTPISATATLTATKSDSPDPVNAGATLTYSINVTNSGPSTATSVAVSDPIPSGTTFVDAAGSGWTCSFASSTVSCSMPSLPVGAAAPIVIHVTSPTIGTSLNNVATVSSAISSPVTASATTTVNAQADLSITKSAPSSLIAGQTLACTITVRNNGPSPAAGVTINDPTPAGLTFVSNQGNCSTAFPCDLGTLAPGASRSITATFSVPSGITSPTIVNTATVSTSTSDPNASNNSATSSSGVGSQSGLSIAKSASPNPVDAGGTLTYSINVTNLGPSVANSIAVTDPLPAGTTFRGVSGNGWSCTQAAGTVTCTLASLAVGAAAPISISVTSPSSGGSITNSATVTATGATPSTGSASTNVIPKAGLSISKSASPNPVDAGGAFTYTINVSNLGPSVANSIAVSDPLPAGTTFRGASGNGWNCTQAAGTVTCTMASLAVGAAAPIAIQVTAPSAAGSLANTATVSAAGVQPVSASNATNVVIRCTNGVIALAPGDGSTAPTAGRLSWDGTGADSFNVYLGPSPGGCQSLFGSTAAESLPYGALAAGQPYEWRVEAVRAGCATTTTACIRFRTATGQPLAMLSAAPLRARRGAAVLLLWSTEDADSVTLDPQFGAREASGSVVDYPAVSTTYVLSARNASGTTTASVQVNISSGPSITALEARPIVLVQQPGIGGATDGYTLRNDGDTTAAIELAREGDFFTQSPSSFTIAPGESETITVSGLPSAAGTYKGTSVPKGDGVPEGTSVPVSMLVSLGSSGGRGTAAAEAVINPIELRAAPSINPSGTAIFRNSGSVNLTATASSREPWILPQAGPYSIAPTATAEVPFTTERARRPDGDQPMGTVAGKIWFDFMGSDNRRGSTEVTVLDTAVPATVAAEPPPIAPNERVYFIPGVGNKPTALGTLLTDMTVAYPFGARSLSVTHLFFTAGGSTTMATIDSLSPSRSFTLNNIVTNVYRSDRAVGTLQLRTADANAIHVSAQRMQVGTGGTVGGPHPVFRSDSAAGAGETTILTGIGSGSGMHTDLFVQETAGAPARARIEFLDAAGHGIGAALERDLTAFGLLEMDNVAPATSVTAIVTNTGISTGKLVAHALLVDDSSGDQSAIVDASRYYGVSRQSSMVIPTAAAARTIGRHRVVGPGTSRAQDINLAIFNAGDGDGQLLVRQYDEQGEIAGEETIALASKNTAMRSVEPSGSALLIPIRGAFVAAARLTGKDTNAALAVLPHEGGLSRGHSSIFAGLSDTRANEPALLLLETSGRAAKVLVTLDLDGGNAPLQFSRQFDMLPRHALSIDGIVRELIGPARDRDFPDLYNLNLEIHIVDGDGAIVPAVITTDPRSGDITIRVE